MLVKGGGRVLALGVGRADQTGGSAASAAKAAPPAHSLQQLLSLGLLVC